jgi:hypothetical protein
MHYVQWYNRIQEEQLELLQEYSRSEKTQKRKMLQDNELDFMIGGYLDYFDALANNLLSERA